LRQAGATARVLFAGSKLTAMRRGECSPGSSTISAERARILAWQYLRSSAAPGCRTAEDRRQGHNAR